MNCDIISQGLEHDFEDYHVSAKEGDLLLSAKGANPQNRFRECQVRKEAIAQRFLRRPRHLALYVDRTPKLWLLASQTEAVHLVLLHLYQCLLQTWHSRNQGASLG